MVERSEFDGKCEIPVHIDGSHTTYSGKSLRIRRMRAVVTLAVVTPILTELFSANMGPREVLNPIGLFLQFMAYGVPVLFIRELAARWRVGLPGLFLMGLAYSLYNEGIIAKTLFFGPPGGGMENYDAFTLGRIHLIWMVLITTWHALHAIVFPIALVSALFGRVRHQPWLNLPAMVVLLTLWLPLSIIGFLKLNSEYAHWGYFTGFVAAITVLLMLGTRLPTRTPFFADGRHGNPHQVLLGMVFYPIVIVGYFIATNVGAPFALLILWPYGWVTLLYLFLRAKRWAICVPIAFIALGNYGLGSFLNMLFQLGQEPPAKDKVVTLALLFGTLAFITGMVLRRSRGTESSLPSPDPGSNIPPHNRSTKKQGPSR